MKIVKYGTVQPAATYRGSCSHCGCEIVVDQNEVCELTPTSLLSGSAKAYFVVCPTVNCHERIPVHDTRGGQGDQLCSP